MLKWKSEQVKEAAAFFVKEIDRLSQGKRLRFMEVCGTHTVAIFKQGLRQLLPEQVELVSGPGCPVCVTPNEYMDQAVAYSLRPGTIITTFGDMLRVPGTYSSLAEEKARGADIRIVYSPMDSVKLAKQHPEKQILFLAVGFETTAPGAAAALLQAQADGLDNFFLLSAHKLVPPALRALLSEGDNQVDGLILPGHVSVVIGLEPYAFLAKEFSMPAVVTGFEALDILQSVYMLTKAASQGQAILENPYARVVKPEGNPVARNILYQVYEPVSVRWRGFGLISDSGLALREAYRSFDAAVVLPLEKVVSKEPSGCCCGEVIKGKIKPFECSLFGKTCRPEQPVGACMVSVEGACAAWYKYGAGRWQV